MGTMAQQGMPRLDTPMVDLPSGNVSIPWYRFLVQLWKLAGGSNIPLSQGVYLVLNNGVLEAYSTATGEFISAIPEINVPGGTPQAITLGSSPHTFTASIDGTIVVSSGSLQIKRGSGAAVLWSLTGGSIRLLTGDSAIISWFGDNAPTAEFLPDTGT